MTKPDFGGCIAWCNASAIVAMAVAFALCAGVAFGQAVHPRAWADDSLVEAISASGEPADSDEAADASNYSQMSLDELKSAIESLNEEQSAIEAEASGLEVRLGALQGRLDAIERQIPPARALADKAVRERYKLQRHGASLIETLLSAPDLNAFEERVTYIEAISEAGIDDYLELCDRRDELELALSQLEDERGEMQARAELVAQELERAIEARDEAQRRADAVANAQLISDGVDWSVGEERFVAEWASRIDAYLAGSPLAGQGSTFAKAAWGNHVDPRFSPAISHIESSKGRLCIRPHNAWGWGAADSDPYGLAKEWGSWEEAINAHVRGLAVGYGYTISVEGAQKYCPPNWENWYSTTVAQMNRI